MLGPYKLQETRRVEKITDRKEELFELRIHVGRRQFRAFFCIRGHRLCILHFVGKKKDRLTKDIDTAERRAKLLSS
jgi:putative component of toxin-antitoxin plasmid stabilization module